MKTRISYYEKDDQGVEVSGHHGSESYWINIDMKNLNVAIFSNTAEEVLQNLYKMQQAVVKGIAEWMVKMDKEDD